MNKWILQAFQGIKEVKVTNTEMYFLKNYDNAYSIYAITQRKNQMRGVLPRPVMECVCISGVLSIMSFEVYRGTDITTFIPTLSVFAVAAVRILPSFNRITNNISTIMFNRTAVDNVYKDLYDTEMNMDYQNKRGSQQNVELKFEKEIILDKITFSYPDSDKKVLNQLDLRIPKNASVAFIGTSGTGKTTLADVILGLLKPTSGYVYVDGNNVHKNITAWHELIGYIPQQIYLMDDTIKSNIALGIPAKEVNERQLWAALDEAQLSEFVRSLPLGINTVVGERGAKLSGGQRQRIGIARALYHNPQILILDEATSSLDNETEKTVMESIEKLHGRRTIMIIAHRLSTIENCDLVYEIKDGKALYRSKENLLRK
ncbi:MAG: ABC transporter ATP-binding protein [Enterocloster sp.]